VITAGDSQTAFYIALGTYTPTFDEWCAADCDGSGTVTAGDSQTIFYAALGMASCVDPTAKMESEPSKKPAVLPQTSGSGDSANGGSRADDIWVEDVSGCNSDNIQVNIMVSNGDTAIDAFTLDLSFDNTMLVYNSCTAGTLDPGWQMFDCNEVSPGEVRVLAFAVAPNEIPAGSLGSIAVLSFTVTCPACNDWDTSVLALHNLYDDIEFFTVTNGTFTYLCPTATPVPTDTPTNTPTSTPTTPPTDTPTTAPTDTPVGPTATPQPIPATGGLGMGLLLLVLGGLLAIPGLRRRR